MTGPLVRFVVGGVQKGGTSALAAYLGAHPGVRLPTRKEAHVFDDPRAGDWSCARFESEYQAHFEGEPLDCLHGDATPIYCFHSRFIERIARYNAAMKWIVLLRDPVDRAISQYHMEHARGFETLPLAAALLAEPFRMRGRHDDFSADSPLRRHSYCARGRYVRQLAALHAHFPPAQVLLLRSMDLLAAPGPCMDRVYAFLGLPAPAATIAYAPVFEGRYGGPGRHPWVRWALRQCFRAELSRLRSQHGIGFEAFSSDHPVVA